nr:PREDICTED: neuronal PAS domain-containing protein 4-like [Lepisosteus oculatus]
MTVSCEYCKEALGARPGTFSCSSPCSNADASITPGLRFKRFRSTKGASKARRDHINAEIRNMRALLPISQKEKDRLSYLHTMSAICTYIRKSVFFQELHSEPGESSLFPYEDFLQALPGFIVATTSEGKLIYISENVSKFLGFSMVDLLQGDSFYDIVENADVETAKSHLQTGSSSETETAFVCRMHTSRAFRLRHGGSCPVLVRGRFQLGASPGSSPVFIALCSPVVSWLHDTDACCFVPHFQSLHGLDMAFTEVPDSVVLHLGYSNEEMICRPWYSLLHPDDLAFAAAQHKILLKADDDMPVEMVLRMQCKNLSWTCFYIVAVKDSRSQSVSCTNYIISETEATFLSEQIHAHVNCRSRTSSHRSSNHYQISPEASDTSQSFTDSPAQNLKRQMNEGNPTEEPRIKTSRISEPSISLYYSTLNNQPSGGSPPPVLSDCLELPSTPPYSPDFQGSPILQEEASSSAFTISDFLLESYSFPESLQSPTAESLPYSVLSALPSPHAAAEALPGIADAAIGINSFGVAWAMSPQLPGSPPHDLSSCSSDVHLVPDCLQLEDVCGGVSDCSFHPDDFGIPESLPAGVPPYLVPHGSVSSAGLPTSLPTPDASPTSESSFHYSEKEQAEISILARQISSLASSFDTRQSVDHVLSALRPSESEAVLSEEVIYGILKELDVVQAKDCLPHCSPTSDRCAESQPSCSDSACALEGSQDLLHSNSSETSSFPHVALEDNLPLDQLSTVHPALDTCIRRSSCNGYANELYQLNEYLHNSLQQDGLVEESMY